MTLSRVGILTLAPGSPLHFNMDFQPLDAQGSPLYSLKIELKSNPTKSNIWHPFWITNIKSGKRYTYTPTEKNKRSDKKTSQTAIFQLLFLGLFFFFFESYFCLSTFLLSTSTSPLSTQTWQAETWTFHFSPSQKCRSHLIPLSFPNPSTTTVPSTCRVIHLFGLLCYISSQSYDLVPALLQ